MIMHKEMIAVFQFFLEDQNPQSSTCIYGLLEACKIQKIIRQPAVFSDWRIMIESCHAHLSTYSPSVK